MFVDTHVTQLAADGSADNNRPFRLPPEILKPANRLLEQQFWLWGCDIRRQEGNILSELGFGKIKAPSETGLSTSQYRCPLNTTCSLALWGFGVCLSNSDLGSTYVPRTGLHPRWCASVVDTASAWTPAWFDTMPQPSANGGLVSCYRLVAQIIDWIAWYERRVIEIAGPAYRQRSIESWNRPVGEATPLAHQWQKLGVTLRDPQSRLRVTTATRARKPGS